MARAMIQLTAHKKQHNVSSKAACWLKREKKRGVFKPSGQSVAGQCGIVSLVRRPLVLHAIIACMSQATAQVIALPRKMVADACALAVAHYADSTLSTGELTADHARGLASILSASGFDEATLAAAYLFALPDTQAKWQDRIEPQFGPEVTVLLAGLHKLKAMRELARQDAATTTRKTSQAETLRKMLLAMVEDIRVVIVRLASRVQTLRYLAGQPGHAQREAYARETFGFYAPLANRLGVWQFKWELEDLSFRFLEPETYKSVAKLLDEKRSEREGYVGEVVDTLQRELQQAGLHADIAGRPKHIYSIVNKMRGKGVGFDQLYDVRAFRVIVRDVRDCYTALGVVHNLWQPVPREFDDYISRPKGNLYRSLHTVVVGPDDKAIEIQIRTEEMHRHAEYGVAAHWRYKEKSSAGKDGFDDKIASLRQLLAWQDDLTSEPGQAETLTRSMSMRHAGLDEVVYVLTPQGRVIDLPQGATPIDFAYSLHTDLGHRCRGAKVDGVMVPLNTPLVTGQRVEIVAAKAAAGLGPSRDWLNPNLGYLASHRARTKVRAWFNAQENAQTVAEGRTLLERELARIGHSSANHDQLAAHFGFADAAHLFAAAGKGEFGLAQVKTAFAEPAAAPVEEPVFAPRKSRAEAGGKGVLVVGVDRLMTQLARCCKPAPPDAIGGFITKGRGVSVHRLSCVNYAGLMRQHPERHIDSEWGSTGESVFAVEIFVEARDRSNLLRDVTEILSKEKVNVVAANSVAKSGAATMRFTLEVENVSGLKRALALISEAPGVVIARRV
jgi:GTP pyrophosphokinase